MADRPLTTLVDLFHNGASINPNKVAVIYDNGQVKLTLKYADLQSQAAQVTSFPCKIARRMRMAVCKRL
jgi:hypothetical protein